MCLTIIFHLYFFIFTKKLWGQLLSKFQLFINSNSKVIQVGYIDHFPTQDSGFRPLLIEFNCIISLSNGSTVIFCNWFLFLQCSKCNRLVKSADAMTTHVPTESTGVTWRTGLPLKIARGQENPKWGVIITPMMKRYVRNPTVSYSFVWGAGSQFLHLYLQF